MVRRLSLLSVMLLVLASCGEREPVAVNTGNTLAITEKENLVDGKRQGQYVRYYPSGQVEMSCNYRDGKLDGPIVFYYEDSGRISRSATYKDGVLVGMENLYYEDGNLKSTLVHGENSSLEAITSFFQSGLPSMEMRRTPGKPYSTLTFYYENGKISEIVNAIKMKPVGDYIAYYEDGSVKKTGSYSDGKLSGTWRFYDQSGNLEREINY